MRKVHQDRKDVRVVVITATNQEETEEEARSLGVIGYMKKPLDIFEIDRITSQVLS
jgi:response regulator of citrate/malate metabolism